jgi:hypothetical protein
LLENQIQGQKPVDFIKKMAVQDSKYEKLRQALLEEMLNQE